MLTAIKQRLERDKEEGFTLIELMVVVLIIAILLAIAIPTFLGARNAANARAAQSNLRNAVTAEQTSWTNTQAFSASLSSIEPSLNWVTTSTVNNTKANSVMAVVSDTNQIVVITALGKDNNCWSMAQVNDPADTAIEGTSYTETAPVTGACSSPTAPANATPTASGSASASTSTAGTWYTSF
jgi:type IV pilus assembly protein PilA